ncbi:unnamed protein product [Chrysodeixis includens]|uniref:Uncharacterized protein n=1 Tax=Chrysodeixis includens TaxID=689277 RepID=A0A9P0FWT6_CHRIL|nr:unnamed protein product [Chrysodeixis includens]
MPKKRNNAWSRRKQQKQMLTARLIEISLKVDEYVYNRKQITNSEAEQFIKEVESYKTTCIRDERSLQVIEKLTRCMKAIILEHQEQADSDGTDDNNTHHQLNYRQPSVSPVYSMCEEDLTYFSQSVDATKNTKDVNEVNEIIDLCIDDDEVDYCNTASHGFIRPRPVTVEVDIHQAVSNLSLQEVPITEEPDTCSQSILNHFEPYVPMQETIKHTSGDNISNSLVINVDKSEKIANVKNYVPHIATNTIVKTPALIIRSDKMFKPISCNTATQKNTSTRNLGDTIEKLKGDSKTLKTVNYNERQDNIKQSNTLHPGPIITIDGQQRPVLTSKFPVVNSKEISQPTFSNPVHNSTSVPTNETNEILVKDKQNITNNVKQKTVELKKKRAPRKKKNVETKPENETKNPTAKRMSKQKTKLPSEPRTNSFDCSANTNTKVPIYNNQVINDLSWMENIRYVREIRLDENDQSLTVDDSFWDNYHLPASWNDSEFM